MLPFMENNDQMSDLVGLFNSASEAQSKRSSNFGSAFTSKTHGSSMQTKDTGNTSKMTVFGEGASIKEFLDKNRDFSSLQTSKISSHFIGDST